MRNAEQVLANKLNTDLVEECTPDEAAEKGVGELRKDRDFRIEAEVYLTDGERHCHPADL